MERRRLVAEVRTATAIQALGVVDALASAGIATIEISLTIPGANEILSHLATRHDILVGAGAVLDPRQAAEAISNGARFISSPIFAPDLMPTCRESNIACMLGALTPTEIIQAQRAGAEMVKLFPVEALGGPMYVRALLRQLTHVSLQISGGFTAENMIEYLQLPVRTLALGSLLVPRVLYERGNWQAITNRARAFVEFAANPHTNAARFLTLIGGATPPRRGEATGQPGIDPVAVISAVPTINIPPAAAAAAAAGAAAAEYDPSDYDASGYDPNGYDPSSSFKPWDSRPIELGDDEDWLR
jgi:2-dehydro-3-deoxyphosphogluconate aldolase/(4S)-4-hydroxy-2-oxoglutarate aldolase